MEFGLGGSRVFQGYWAWGWACTLGFSVVFGLVLGFGATGFSVVFGFGAKGFCVVFVFEAMGFSICGKGKI